MQAHGTELAATLSPQADGTQSAARTPDRPCARPFGALPASAVRVAGTGEEINYSAEDSDILTAISSGLTRLRGWIIGKNTPPHRA